MMIEKTARALRYYRHRLAHRLGLQGGNVVTEWWQGRIWCGFQCATCGEVSHASPVSKRAIDSSLGREA